ncbi:hypothetical protein SU45_00125 [Brachyspira hyodysenteriae]|uniref:hypothetical protein n=1 Tax=Brachyspira hyodysenteriae TaxID=159 RepID=UPI00063DC076|nr:hypothetical protein [Brachyspira hyodysenteriae]KLI19590.1 hypothetical protein SU45_00125 [Brachyspira hyodysenteriae]
MESYIKLEYNKNEDIVNIDYKMNDEEFEFAIAYLMVIHYEKNNKNIKRINKILSIFDILKEDTSNITHITL